MTTTPATPDAPPGWPAAERRQLRERDRREPAHGPGTHRAADRVRGRHRPGPPALAADVAAGLGPRAHRQPGRAVAAARRGRPGADAPGDRPALRRVRAPARRAAHAAAAAARRGPRATPGRSAAGSWTCWSRPSSPGPRWSPAGFAFGMVAQHEQQHDETMLITHQLRRGAAALAAAPPGPPPPDALRLPRRGAGARRPVHHGHLHRAVGAGQRAARAPGDVPAFYLDTTPVSNAAYQEFIADGGYDDPRWWSPAGWDHRQRAGLAAPLYWRREGGRLDPRPVRGDRAGAARRAGDARVLVRGAMPTPAGPGGGCRPRPSGRRRPGSTRPPGGPAGTPGATRTRPRSGRTWASSTCSPRRRAATRRAPRRAARASSSVTSGSGPAATSCPTRALPPGRTASTPRSSSGPSTR